MEIDGKCGGHVKEWTKYHVGTTAICVGALVLGFLIWNVRSCQEKSDHEVQETCRKAMELPAGAEKTLLICSCTVR